MTSSLSDSGRETEGRNLDPEPRRSWLDVAFHKVKGQILLSVSFLMMLKGCSPRIGRLVAQTPEKSLLSASTGPAHTSCKDEPWACVGHL